MPGGARPSPVDARRPPVDAHQPQDALAAAERPVAVGGARRHGRRAVARGEVRAERRAPVDVLQAVGAAVALAPAAGRQADGRDADRVTAAVSVECARQTQRRRVASSRVTAAARVAPAAAAAAAAPDHGDDGGVAIATAVTRVAGVEQRHLAELRQLDLAGTRRDPQIIKLYLYRATGGVSVFFN